jgi:hypothetical protein
MKSIVSKNEKPGPKNFFLHLLAMVALYTSAAAFLTIIFQYINLAFPDVLEGRNFYSTSGAYQGIRWGIASIIVAFPVYVWVTWFLNKIYSVSEAVRESRIRRWLTYLTLFVAAVVIGGDLITLVFKLLEGEFTARFILKVLVVLFVAVSVFVYYIWELKKYGDK